MKTYTFRTLTSVWLFAMLLNVLPLGASVVYRSVEQFEKRVSKEFAVNADATVELKNKFGKIHVNTWDQNKVTIDVVISVDTRSKEAAEKIFENIKIEMSGSKSHVSAETIFKSKSNNDHNKKNLRIDYTVNMPRKAAVDLYNRFGDIYLGDLLGSCKIDLAYGSMRAGDLDNKVNSIELQFSDGEIKFIALGELELQYSDMEIEKVGSLEIETQFSDLEIGPAGELKIHSQYDDISLEGASKLRLNTQFSDIHIEQITKEFHLINAYGDIEVERIPSDMETIYVDNQFGDVDLGIERGTSYILDAKGSFSDINLPDNFKVREKTKGNTSFRYFGTVGDDPGERTVTIDTSYGDVDLY